jgi:hypothetical protein
MFGFSVPRREKLCAIIRVKIFLPGSSLYLMEFLMAGFSYYQNFAENQD